MKKEEFLNEVIIEIEKIKELATDQKKRQLDFYTFDPENKEKCIYGQMTGNCRSERAVELINQCTIRIIDFNGYKGFITPVRSFTAFKKFINGLVSDGFKIKRSIYMYQLSTLETYIMTDKAQGGVNENIIEYIKGETNELTLK